MRLIKSSVFLISTTIAFSAFAEEKKIIENCTSTREYITTQGYLKDKKEYALDDKKIAEVANIVAGGCTGAASRFIQTMSFLVDAEVPANQALNYSKTIALEDDVIFNNFISIFKKIYVEKYFDLSTTKSLKMASELTAKMDREPKIVLEDFNTLADFCMNEKELDLGYDRCADFVLKTLVNSKEIKASIGKAALDFFDFLVRDQQGPKISTLKALEEIEKVSLYGNTGYLNYKEAFVFSNSEKGMNLKNDEAMKFAYDMASKSIKK
jgi:hypothetical protein